MAPTSLADNHGRSAFFRQCILNSIHYWHSQIADNINNISALDFDRNSIVKTILFALKLEEAWGTVCDLILSFTPYMERKGYWEVWNGVLQQAITAAQQLDDTTAEVKLSVLLARLLFWRSHFTKSIYYYRRTIYLARQVDDQYNEARACTNLGYYYAERSQWYRSEILCYHALKLFEQLDDAHGQAHTQNHLGFLYTRQHQWQLAQQHLEQACVMWQSQSDQHGLMRGYINLGLLHLQMKQFGPAMSYLEKALDQAKLTSDETEIGNIYINMGLVNTSKGDFVNGEKYTRQAEATFEQFRNIVGLAQVWDNLGMACLYQGKQTEALAYLEASIEMWRKLNNKQGEMETLADLAKYYIIIGNKSLAQKQLANLDIMLAQFNQTGAYNYLQSTLEEHRRSLTTKSDN